MRKALVTRLICIVTAFLLAVIGGSAKARDEVVLSIIGDHIVNDYMMDDNMVFADFVDAYNGLTKNVPYLELIFERLFEYIPSPTPSYNPILAENYTIEPYGESGAAYVIKLRQDAYWHDGEPFTSGDVLSSYYMGFLAGWEAWNYIDSIAAPDDYTVTINVRDSGPLVTRMILSGEVMACPAHLYKDLADQAISLTGERDPDGYVNEALREKIAALSANVNLFAGGAIGTGVYKLDKTSADKAELVKNEQSPFSSDAKVDRIIVSELDFLLEDMISDYEYDKEWFVDWFKDEYVGETSDGAILLDEYHTPLTGTMFDIMREVLPDLRLVELPGRNKLSFKMNMRYYPFSESIVRKALQFAADREAFTPVLASGIQDGYLTGMPDTMRDEWLGEEFKGRLMQYGYDPEMAVKLMEGIGFAKLDDGYYQDETLDVPEFEVISYEPTMFYAPFAECAGILSGQFEAAGLASDTYFYDRQDYGLTMKDGEWMVRFDITPYVADPYEVYSQDTDRVLLTDGTIVFLDTVTEQLMTNDYEELPDASGQIPEQTPEQAQWKLEKEELIKTLAIIHNDLAMEIPLGDTPTAFAASLPGWNLPERADDWRYYGEGFEPLAKLLRTGALAMSGY